MRERHQQLQKNNNSGEKKSIKLTFNGIQQNPNQTFTYNGTQIKMSCACGSLSLVSIISSKGKSSQLTNYLSNGGHYIVIYGYDKDTNTFLFYDGYNGRGYHSESWDVVNSSVVEYIAIG